MTPWLAALLPIALGHSDPPATLRADHRAITPAEARTMTPAALGDALLVSPHPPIRHAFLLPSGMAPPLPPDTPILLWVNLVTAPVVDAALDFCRVVAIDVRTTQPGREGADRLTETSLYRWRDKSAAAPCDRPDAIYFTPMPTETARALAVVRLIDAGRRTPPGRFILSVDDQEGREVTAYRRDHPSPGDRPVTIVTDPHAALRDLPLGNIGYVGHDLFNADLLPAAQRLRPDGTPYETWQLYANDWTIHVALDGDRIVAMRLRRAIPGPF